MDQQQQVLPIEKLKTWEVNDRIRSLNIDDFEKLKDKLTLKPQFKPIIVTPDADGMYIVLGGNHRLKAYKELGVRSPLWVAVVEFKQDQQGLWFASMYGQDLPERFQTKEDAMLDWSMVDNEEFAYYDRAELVNEMGHHNLDWSQYAVSMEASLPIPDMLKKYGIEEIDEDDTDTTNEPKSYQVVIDCQNDIEQSEIMDKLESLNVKAKAVTR
jgi:hypothetical protein